MASSQNQQSRGQRRRPSGHGSGHGHGIVVIVLLAVLFVGILGLLVVFAGKRRVVPLPTRAETLSVIPMRIRIRTQPNPNAPVVVTAESGQKLTLLEDRGAWVRVQNAEGLSGWAERSGLERTAELERRLARFAAIRKLPALDGVVSSRAPLYAGPGIFYPLVGELPADEHVKVYTRDHDFYAINTGDRIAYADIDAIDVSASGRQLDVSSATPETSTAPMATDTTASAAAPESATAPPPLAEASPPASPERAETDQAGVYAAVPSGGTQPEEIYRPIPIYPAMARRVSAAGSVVLRGIVRKDGSVDELEIIKDLPYGLGDAARDAVRRWRFRPATYRGEPIDVYYTVTVNFRLTP
jgi:TonB family protein